MLLIIEIALGVALGLWLFVFLQGYRNRLISWALAVLLGLVWVTVVGGFFALAGYGILHSEALRPYRDELIWASIVLILSALVFGYISDKSAQRKAQSIFQNQLCEQCGNIGLQFKRFKGGLEAPSGKEHDHPVGSCQQCGHEQELA